MAQTPALRGGGVPPLFLSTRFPETCVGGGGEGAPDCALGLQLWPAPSYLGPAARGRTPELGSVLSPLPSSTCIRGGGGQAGKGRGRVAEAVRWGGLGSREVAGKQGGREEREKE